MYLLADIGGTKMRIAGAKDPSKFDAPIVLRTPESYEEALALFVDTAKSIAGNETISAIAIGAAITLSPDKRSILRSENLPQWGGHAFADDLEKALQSKVYVENDTALVGLGEATYGAGKGSSIVAYITISTGVNGVRIIDGAIDRASLGFEIGGQYLSHEGDLQTLEQLVSGSAVHERLGVHPRDLGKDWQGWEDLARIAAIGVHNTILHWSPELVVLGGSMFNGVGISVDSVKKHLQEIMKKFPHIPEIVHSSLHDEGGLYGGLARLK
jgi:predicted NBD/HSP70 family sugar kinase